MGCFDVVQPPELTRIMEANDNLVKHFIKVMIGFPAWHYLPPRWFKTYR